MRFSPLSMYAAAAVAYASPFATTAQAVGSVTQPQPARAAFRVVAPPRAASIDQGTPAMVATMEQPRSLLEAMIVQMGGAARASGKGVFIDLRV